MVKPHVIGAHYGLKDWLAQRVTAIYMALFTLGFVICAFCHLSSGFSFDAWHALWASPGIKFFGFLFVLALCYHAWVGVRDIWMDYVKPVCLRLALHIITLFALTGYVGWAVWILWSLSA